MDIISRFMEIVKESRDDLDSLRSVLKEFCLYCGAGALLRDGSRQISAEGALPENFIKYISAGGLYDVYEPMVNIDAGEYRVLAFPVVAALNRLGTLFFCRKTEFSDEEIGLAKICAIISALKLARIIEAKADRQAQKISAVRSAMGTLSYTELLAVTRIFEIIEREGVVVASKIAEQHSITRSVIVSALRKLESAGIIEARSLGMKGTHIKVLNEFFIREMEKLGRV